MCISKDGEDFAIIQVLKKKISLLGYITRINRGPIFLKEEIDFQLKIEILEKVIHEVKLDSLLLQIAPEMSDSEELTLCLNKLGLSRLKSTPWASGFLDLKLNEDELLMSVNGKWRNCYRKGVKMGVIVSDVSDSNEELNELVKSYENLKTSKDFIGLSKELIYSLAKEKNELWKFNIFKAHLENERDALGYLVTIDHGDTSIYLIGLTTDIGRKYQANYAMLWLGILNAKRNGCSKFDIGGLNDDTPSGVAHFKNGLKSSMYSLSGEWRGVFLKNLIRF